MSVETSSGGKVGRVQGIESLRALAAIAVFYCHLATYWGRPGQHLPGKVPQLVATGAHGVDFFVVISGFCLGIPVMASGAPLALRTFYVRRASRLLPPYYVALAFAALVAMTPLFTYTVAAQASWTQLLQHLALVQTWSPGTIGTINGSMWSIALEAHLYLLFPVLLMAWRRWGAAPVLVTSAVLSIGWTSLATLHMGVLGSLYVLPARLVEFAVGMWCAQVVRSGRLPGRRLLWTGLLAGGVAALAVSTADIERLSAVAWSVPSASAVLLVASAARRPLLDARPLVALGTISYSFYLVHQPLQLLSSGLAARIAPGPTQRYLLGATFGVVIVAMLCLPMYLFVERPSQGLGRRLSRRGAPRPALA